MPEEEQDEVLFAEQDVEFVRRRFEACKKCGSSTDDGFGCKHHTGCCFGRWRTDAGNKCPEGRWEGV